MSSSEGFSQPILGYFFLKAVNLTRKVIKHTKGNEEWGERGYLKSLCTPDSIDLLSRCRFSSLNALNRMLNKSKSRSVTNAS